MKNKDKLKKIIDKMTLKEKIAQLYQIGPDVFSRSSDASLNFSGAITGPKHQQILNKDVLYSIGSILNCDDVQVAYEIQKEYLDHSRLQIPLLFMFDIIHGFKTIFPIPLGLACSWDPELVEETAKIAAREGAAAGVNVTFAPMADLVRDPRWGRVMESPGEDPFLTGVMTAAYVRGFQGEDLKAKDTMAACVKHFAAYGAAEGGRDYNTVDMSEWMLRNIYLPGYRPGIDAGAAMVMSSFNIVGGIPATGNKLLLKQILRHEWGFEGVVISDYDSVNEMIPHGMARNGKEAALKAIEAGLDIEMASVNYVSHLEELVNEDIIEEEKINQAVLRILNLKDELGLFDDPFRYLQPKKAKEYFLTPKNRQVSRKAAAESLVLLKNDGVLPLSKELNSVAIIGPYADNHQILGWWSALGEEKDSITLREGISAKAGENTDILVEKGCGFDISEDKDFTDAVEVAKRADAVILALGEPQDYSGEGGSRAYLDLPGHQQDLAAEILKLDKPTVLVLFNGRPLELTWYDNNVPAILEAWFPGTEGGNAIADVLFGDVNPSGRLTMSFPYTLGQVPVYYNHFNTGRPLMEDNKDYRFVSKYLDAPNEPLYTFGYGLSYTEFEYTNLKLEASKLRAGEIVEVSVEISNTGSYAGEEVVQLYIRDNYGSTVRPVLELKDFKKVYLKAGETRKVKFEINEGMLAHYQHNLEYGVESGYFTIYIGPNSKDVIEAGKLYYEN